jgi:hypothetical protein
MTRRGVGTKREMGDNEREMIIVVCNVVCFLLITINFTNYFIHVHPIGLSDVTLYYISIH